MKKILPVVFLFFLLSASFVYALHDAKDEPKTGPLIEADPKEMTAYDKELERTVPEIDKNGEYIIRKSFGVHPYHLISIGPGIQVITINFGTKNIGFVDSVSPFNFAVNFVQRRLIHWVQDRSGNWGKEMYDFAFWVPSIGIVLSKPEETNAFEFGVNLVPWSIKINDFAFGLGIEWLSVGKAEFHLENFGMIIPITYTFSF